MNITYKLLNGMDEQNILKELKSLQKIGQTAEVTTRLKYVITSVDGDEEQTTINLFVDNMLSRDSMALRQKLADVSPDIDLEQEIDVEGESVKVLIPMTVNFFWPKTN